MATKCTYSQRNCPQCSGLAFYWRHGKRRCLRCTRCPVDTGWHPEAKVLELIFMIAAKNGKLEGVQ